MGRSRYKITNPESTHFITLTVLPDHYTTIVGLMNLLFDGALTDDDMLNYARTITDKVRENDKVVQQVANNLKEQEIMGGGLAAVAVPPKLMMLFTV